MSNIYKERFRVRIQDADLYGKAKLSSLCNYLQETAGRHANSLGFGFDDARERNQLWVIVGLMLKIHKYPLWEEEVTVETWPVKVQRLFAFRDFRIKDLNGEVLASASSYWMVIDATSRRPKKPEIVDGIDWIEVNDGYELPDPPMLRHLQMGEDVHGLHVRFNDLDFNGHVNNIRYIDWCMDAFPEEHHKKYSIETFSINFLAEVHADDELRLKRALQNDDEYLIEGRRLSDDKAVFRVEMVWR
jgi:acyl-ACP thioesterase